MEKAILRDIAYLYYPLNICNVNQREQYLYSSEFKKLSFVLNSFFLDDSRLFEFNLLLKKLKQNELLKNIQDNTSLQSDRCLTFNIEFIEDEKRLLNICINISVLIPYYFIYVEENEIVLNPYKWVTLPSRNKYLEEDKFKAKIQLISSIIEKTINFKLFSDDLLNLIIPNISYQDNSIGNFTMYNAFFNDKKNL